MFTSRKRPRAKWEIKPGDVGLWHRGDAHAGAVAAVGGSDAGDGSGAEDQGEVADSAAHDVARWDKAEELMTITDPAPIKN